MSGEVLAVEDSGLFVSKGEGGSEPGICTKLRGRDAEVEVGCVSSGNSGEVL